MSNILFMVEGGKALELVKAHIEEHKVVIAARKTIAAELGIEHGVTDPLDGRLLGVRFPNDRHPDFKAPNRKGICYPKKNSEWAKRFTEAPGYQNQTNVISHAFGVPCSLAYTTKDGGQGWTCIGNMLNECGFLYLSENGPYAMWIPNVPAEVALMEEDGKKTVEEPARSFVPKFEGCQRIEEEEWEILVAQHKLEKKRKKAEGAPA